MIVSEISFNLNGAVILLYALVDAHLCVEITRHCASRLQNPSRQAVFRLLKQSDGLQIGMESFTPDLARCLEQQTNEKLLSLDP